MDSSGLRSDGRVSSYSNDSRLKTLHMVDNDSTSNGGSSSSSTASSTSTQEGFIEQQSHLQCKRTMASNQGQSKADTSNQLHLQGQKHNKSKTPSTLQSTSDSNMQMLQKHLTRAEVSDQLRTFGKFVANELRGIYMSSNDVFLRRTQRQVQQVLIKAWTSIDIDESKCLGSLDDDQIHSMDINIEMDNDEVVSSSPILQEEMANENERVLNVLPAKTSQDKDVSRHLESSAVDKNQFVDINIKMEHDEIDCSSPILQEAMTNENERASNVLPAKTCQEKNESRHLGSSTVHKSQFLAVDIKMEHDEIDCSSPILQQEVANETTANILPAKPCQNLFEQAKYPRSSAENERQFCSSSIDMKTERIHCTPPPPILQEVVNEKATNQLPAKSANIYEKVYQQFMAWCHENSVESYSELVLIAYFRKKAKEVKSSTLWSTYSMLKSTLLVKHNIEMKPYSRLLAFIKAQNATYKPKKSNIFTREEFLMFLSTAPDDKYLMWKVCFIFGVTGACRMEELKRMSIDDIIDTGNALVITIPDSKLGKRTFTITDNLPANLNLNPIDIYRKYRALRPLHITHKTFFVFYHEFRCTVQPIGIHTFGKIPTGIAKFLKLSDAKMYTGHAFRRTSASLLADTGTDVLTLKHHGGWKSTQAAKEYVEWSNSRKQQDEIASRILTGNASILTRPSTVTSLNTTHECNP